MKPSPPWKLVRLGSADLPAPNLEDSAPATRCVYLMGGDGLPSGRDENVCIISQIAPLVCYEACRSGVECWIL